MLSSEYFLLRNSLIACRGFNEAVNGFADDGWSMVTSDGIDDVTVFVNSSTSKMMGLNLGIINGFASTSSSVLCAKASMLLQVSMLNFRLLYIYTHICICICISMYLFSFSK